MSKPTDQVLGHAADNDGIEEYDNPLPTWWLGLFYFTIVWGVIYAAEYHFVANRSQAAAYDLEAAAARASMPAASTASAPGVPTPALAVAGKAIYETNCVACHGPELKGGVGPDLTDATWIHGGTYADVVRVVTEGVPEKGMITWGPILGPQKIAEVAAYVHGSGGGQ
mgnify:CR=1 FL=1